MKNSLKSKVIFYAITTILLVFIVILLLFEGQKRTMDQYHTNFQRVLVLNQITQNTIDTHENLNAYLLQRVEFYEKFEVAKENLIIHKEHSCNEVI